MKNNSTPKPNTSATLIAGELLRLIFRSPDHFAKNESILKALRSQGALAKLELNFEDSGVQKIKPPMSINTLKSHANLHFKGGFKALDALRLAALMAIEKVNNSKESNSTKRTKSGLARLVVELEERLEKQQCTNMVLLQGLNLAINELRNIRSNLDSALLEKRASDAVQALTALLSLPPEQPSSPSPLSGSRRVTRLEEYRK
ncbi:hypothetical protein D9M69_248310 [compost metagenome]